MSNKLPGEMLQSNLTRSGTNLTFDNDLLHLDVAARRVGIGTVTPDQGLAVEGSARLDDIVVQGTTLSATTGNITLTPSLGSNVVIDSGTANSLAFFGPANEIQGSALLYFDGASLVVDTTTTIANTTFTPGQILSDQALQITTLSGDITLAPGGGGAVVIPNLTISNLPVNRLLYSDPTGVMRTAAAFAFDDVTSTATLIGTLNVDDVTIEDNSISSLSATPLTIASQNIEINALGGDITIDNAYATGVFYADPLKALSTSAALTFDNTNGILYANNVTTTGVVVAPTFRTNNLEIAGNDIYSMDTGDIVTVYGSATNNVLKTGDTMSGFLTLHADPDLAFHAATKNYVDQVAQDKQPLDSDLTAIAGLAANGLIARTGTGTAVTRSIAVSGTGLSITNADGIAGNPTITSNATSANTASTIVARDASGNFIAGTITAALAGNATTATALQTARTISLTGDVTGSVSFDGTANVSITATVADDSHNHIIANVDGLQTALDLRVLKDSNTGSAALPAGTTAQRSAAPAAGALRFNSTLAQFEGYNGSDWGTVGGGATGAPGNYVFNLNDQNVTGDYTIPSGKNAMTAGPITVDNGVTVTVPDGSVWTVV